MTAIKPSLNSIFYVIQDIHYSISTFNVNKDYFRGNIHPYQWGGGSGNNAMAETATC